MAYSADSFTALEIPTLAKMNKLWSNDASFNDGTGIANNAILTRHILDANVTSPKLAVGTPALIKFGNIRIQHGWGFVTGTGGVSAFKTIVFPEAFATIPKVFVSMIGYKVGSNPTSETDFAAEASWTVGGNTVTTSQFAAFYSQATGTLASNIRILFYWLAIG